MIRNTSLFNYRFEFAALTDIGIKRTSNQDEVVVCPQWGFHAVSDGMGGLPHGGDTSIMIRDVLPLMMEGAFSELRENISPEYAANLLQKAVCLLSDNIYDMGNRNVTVYGATLSGVWLVGRHAVFVNLGDSRGYLLPRYRKKIQQVTRDHNIAAILVDNGELTREEALNHPSSSSLLCFMGMPEPATPDVFIREVAPGDRLLLCSDGLYGTVEEKYLPRLMRSSRKPETVCRKLTDTANANGGRDNISAVYLKIYP
jgi:serine/threonine protein phosphatase PrpC